MRSRISIKGCVCPSVLLSVGPSVGWSVRRSHISWNHAKVPFLTKTTFSTSKNASYVSGLVHFCLFFFFSLYFFFSFSPSFSLFFFLGLFLFPPQHFFCSHNFHRVVIFTLAVIVVLPTSLIIIVRSMKRQNDRQADASKRGKVGKGIKR